MVVRITRNRNEICHEIPQEVSPALLWHSGYNKSCSIACIAKQTKNDNHEYSKSDWKRKTQARTDIIFCLKNKRSPDKTKPKQFKPDTAHTQFDPIHTNVIQNHKL